MRFFRSTPAEAPAPKTAQRLTRRSSAMAELSRLFKSDDPLCVLDIGATSASNIRFFTEKGHRIYSQDLLEASTDPELVTKDEQGQLTLDSKKFLEDNLAYANGHFDIVFCWNLADYMDESLVKPVIARLWSVMKPGGMLKCTQSMPNGTAGKHPRNRSRCSGSSTTATSKTSSAILPRLSFSSPATTFGKCWW